MNARHHMRAAVLAALPLFLASSLLVAQSAPADTTDRLKLSADLGLVVASGNTNLVTFSFNQQLDLLLGNWTLHQGARMVNGSADGAETANEYAVFVQPEYRLSPRWKAYVLGSWDRNPFLGIAQRFQEGVGVAYRALSGPRHSLSLEAGGSLFQQEFTSGTSSVFPTARAAATYRLAFTPKAYVQEAFVYLPDLSQGGGYRINNELSLVAPLFGHFALKASYVLQFQSAPQPGFRTTDNLFTTGFQVTY